MLEHGIIHEFNLEKFVISAVYKEALVQASPLWLIACSRINASGIWQIQGFLFLTRKDSNHVSKQYLSYLLGNCSGLHVCLTEHHRNLE